MSSGFQGALSEAAAEFEAVRCGRLSNKGSPGPCQWSGRGRL